MRRRIRNPMDRPASVTITFNERDANPLAPLHRRLGIATHVVRQVILNDPRMREWDAVTRVWSHNHLYRDSITLAGAAA